MSIKGTIASVYVFLGLVTTIYGSIWGDYSYKGFAYNLGAGLVWPCVWFPTLGKIVGGIITLIVIGYIVLAANRR